ncbi:glycosyltransferase [Microbulbifer hydrolyticus]|uniref:Glycosyltransferase n=1 Tax=Microbulbifer hydrolyticus TaxID=48074 RepID=A0A6P1T3V5_9GAMM|nr:glycosyltransferase family 4 protein [Microbulbifer hydrolyticus]MBB5211664.1 glycosyltransferase involved in cell wall biosynthesis [Microbulbifer hydrolyticus]QHQ37604.1 glycosyltransferase [Microbulbifer hydrolyticus]
MVRNESNKTALLIAKQWPEPTSTAAGRRTLDILDLLADAGYRVEIASPAQPTPFQAKSGYGEHQIEVNDSSFDPWVHALDPALVVYDRFMMEEQFGWRVREQCPGAITLLDTSDFHSLREARHQALKSGQPLNLFHPIAEREVAAMARCDLTVMISQIEVELLQRHFCLPDWQLHYLPFLVRQLPDVKALPGFDERQHLVMIGGFKHAPNRDATTWFAQEVWPRLHALLPGVECHIYGAYSDHAMHRLSDPATGLRVHGRAEDALATLARYRLNLAPLRFGAGQKGKILEGWLSGTPTVTTPIGAESMAPEDLWGYPLSDDPQQFATTTAQLYQNKTDWLAVRDAGTRALESGFRHKDHAPAFIQRIEDIAANLDAHRNRNIWGRILRRTAHRAEEFMSRWIEEKNKRNDG